MAQRCAVYYCPLLIPQDGEVNSAFLKHVEPAWHGVNNVGLKNFLPVPHTGWSFPSIWLVAF